MIRERNRRSNRREFEAGNDISILMQVDNFWPGRSCTNDLYRTYYIAKKVAETGTISLPQYFSFRSSVQPPRLFKSPYLGNVEMKPVKHVVSHKMQRLKYGLWLAKHIVLRNLLANGWGNNILQRVCQVQTEHSAWSLRHYDKLYILFILLHAGARFCKTVHTALLEEVWQLPWHKHSKDPSVGTGGLYLGSLGQLQANRLVPGWQRMRNRRTSKGMRVGFEPTCDAVRCPS